MSWSSGNAIIMGSKDGWYSERRRSSSPNRALEYEHHQQVRKRSANLYGSGDDSPGRKFQSGQSSSDFESRQHCMKPQIRSYIRDTPRLPENRLQTPYIPSSQSNASRPDVRKRRDAAGEFRAPRPLKKKARLDAEIGKGEESRSDGRRRSTSRHYDRLSTGSTRVPTGRASNYSAASPLGTPSYRVSTT